MNAGKRREGFCEQVPNFYREESGVLWEGGSVTSSVSVSFQSFSVVCTLDGGKRFLMLRFAWGPRIDGFINGADFILLVL